ncbi:MAG: alpha/beta hydrolase, partial [Pseudomonadota bacterium]
MRAVIRILTLSLALSLGACTGLLFHPQSELLITPDRVGVAYRDIAFTAADGVELHGWFLPAETGAASGEACTVLFLHGNAENISTHLGAVWWLPAKGYNVFLFDYRGYGHSAGEPTLPGLHLDDAAALETVFAMEGVDSGKIVVFAQSLGGAVAITALAQSPYRHRVRALITESAFSDYRGITREKLAGFWLTWPLRGPLSLTMNNDYKPLEAIGKISPTPVLI